MKNPMLHPAAYCCKFLLPLLFLLSSKTVNSQKPYLSQWVTNGNVYTTVVDNNYVYVGGPFSAVRKPTGPLAKFTTGSDKPASCFPYVQGTVSVTAPDGSGGWFIAGQFTSVGGIPRTNLAHILSTGLVDVAWDAEADNTVAAMVVSGSYVYIGGAFSMVRKSTSSSSYLSRLNIVTGERDTTWTPEPDAGVNTIVVNGSDIYVGGDFTTIGGLPRNYIAKLNNTNGAANASWNPNSDGPLMRMVLSGTDLYVAGSFSIINGLTRYNIAKINVSNGTADAAWNANADAVIYSMAVVGSDLYVGGEIISIGGLTPFSMARLSTATGAGDATWNIDASSNVTAITYNSGYLYIGGTFTSVNGITRYNIARIDPTGSGSVDATWDPKLTAFDPSFVSAITINNSDIMVSGNFLFTGYLTRNNLARFHRSTGEPDETWDPNPNDAVTHLFLEGNDLYVGGHFTSIGGQSRNRLAKINTSSSNADATWNPDVNSYISCMVTDGTDLYISGVFTTVGGQSRNRLAKVNKTNGAVDASWNPNANNIVNTIAFDGTDIYAGGIFTTIGGLSRNRIAKLNTTTGAVDATWDANANLNLFSIITDASHVYVAGAFSTIGGLTRNNIARLNKTTGAADAGWNPAASHYVRTLKIDGQYLYVGGEFGTISGVQRWLAARLDKATGVADAWNPNFNGIINFNIDVLTVYEFAISGSEIYVGGDYTGTFRNTTLSAYYLDGFAKLPAASNVTWTGSSGNNWGSGCNWDSGDIPSLIDDVLIPAGTPNSPNLQGESFSVKSVTLNASQNIQTGTGTLSVKENLVNNGTILSATTGKLILNGTSAQTLSGTGSIENLTLDNTTGATITSGQTNITGTLAITTGTLTTGGMLTLKSSSAATARVAPLTGTPISGNVTVERYIPAKSSRKWSFVACPVSGNTIRNGWQDDVFITGAGTGGTYCGTGGAQYNSNGFDATVNSTLSMFTYNATPVNGTRYVSVSNTTATNLTPGTGYRMIIRGPRGIADANCTDQLYNLTPPSPAAATLSATGTLMQDNTNVPVYGKTSYNAISGTGNAYTFIGNPYASEVSLQSMYAANNSIITSSFWFYSSLNASNIFSTYNAATRQATDFPSGYTNGSNVTDVIIASGQAFLVERSGNADANITFSESHKITTATPGNNFFRNQSVITDKIMVQLSSTADAELKNSIYINYLNDAAASFTDITSFDSYSFNTGNTFFLAGLKSGRSMAIQTRGAFNGNDTVILSVKGNAGVYQLSFSEFNDFTAATDIKLLDAFTGTVTDIRSNSNYAFSITSNSASQGTARFKIVFRSAGVLPISGIELNGIQKQSGVQLNWQVLAEKDMRDYTVQRSTDGRNFTSIGKVSATGNKGNNTSYSWMDVQQPEGVSYYRISAAGNNGEVSYSATIKMQQGKSITLYAYPNPVKDALKLVLSGRTDPSYSLRIINAFGQQVMQRHKTVPVAGIITANVSSLSAGVYTLQLTNTMGDVITEKFIKQ